MKTTNESATSGEKAALKTETETSPMLTPSSRNRNRVEFQDSGILTPEGYAADRAFAAELRATMAQIDPRIPVWAMASGPPSVEQTFGPFKNVPSELIHSAGFRCPLCGRKVKRLALKTSIVPRLMIYVCKCVNVTTWEDETAPTVRTWPDTIELARLTGAGILMFNGGGETPPDFQGIN
jgi:hypothetical protein